MAQRIFIGRDQLLVCHLYKLLESAGIAALMQKSIVDMPPGDSPGEESTPLAWYSELWVLHDDQLQSAARLLQGALAVESRDLPASVIRMASGGGPAAAPETAALEGGQR